MTLESRPRAIFLDDGGVMNDNSLRGPQWQRLVGEFMPPRLGGRPEQWAEANRTVIGPLWDDFQHRANEYPNFAAFSRAHDVAWVRVMCEFVGVAVPPDDEAAALAEAATAYIAPQIRAAYPRAIEAVRTLHAAGFTLHTASNETSAELDAYLTGMQVRECFTQLYGPDLIDQLKDGPEYYRRMFAHAGIDATEAMVVDDKPQLCGWAREAGARAVCVGTGLEAGAVDDLQALAARLLD
jgi:HAD superfamily hydrolase (TIGR01509 family)